MDKLLDALRETLAAKGFDDSAIEEILKETVAKAEGEGDPEPSGDPQPNPTGGDVPPTPADEPVPEGEGDPTQVADPIPPSEGDVPPEGDPVPPQDVPAPVDPIPAPTVPPFDPTELIAQISDLTGKLDEEHKANEGLVARIQSLEEALKNAGIIDGSVASQVGDQLPSDNPQEPTEDVFSETIRQLNGGRRF